MNAEYPVLTDEQIVQKVMKYHCLAEPAVEIPAIIDAFLFAGGDRFLEIGTWQGATVAAIALATPQADIWTVDLPEPHRAKRDSACPPLGVGLTETIVCDQLACQSCFFGISMLNVSTPPPITNIVMIVRNSVSSNLLAVK